MPDRPSPLRARYPSGPQFRRALEDRLKRHAAESSVALPRLQKLVVFERLLARLFTVAEGRWVVKGGLALEFRLGARARFTKDLDLVPRESRAEPAGDLAAAAALDLDDYFRFVVEGVV